MFQFKYYCCVPLYNQRETVDANGKRVGFFNFPKDSNLRAQWLQKIRRDVGTKFKLTEIANVCSLHFRKSEIRKGLGGRKMSVDVHHRSSFEICMAYFTSKETAAVCKIFTEEEQASSGRIIHGKSFTVSSDITSEADDTVSLETAEIVNTESQDSSESLRFHLLQA